MEIMIPDEENIGTRAKREDDKDRKKKKKKKKKKRRPAKDRNKPLKVLHITDIHYDSDYLVGGWGKCREPLCCQKDKGKANNSEDTARHWGDFRLCDTPLHTVEMTFEHINKQHVRNCR